VIATTSTAEKAERLRALGASEVINYTETPDWDTKVRELTDGRGVDCLVEIGGPGTIAMSLQALAVGGHISLIGSSLTPVGVAGPPHRHRPGPASQELTTATASISIMKSGPARRVTPTVVLVGVATPR
jgi:NADPH:quinone reductase-like Zn-dependent oxidoreductase